MTPKTLYIIRGLPGSGKSTLAFKLGNGELFPHFEADQYHMKDGAYQWKPENVAAAHQWCQAAVENAMVNGDWSIVVANTFTRQWEMDPYRKLAGKYNYLVVYITVKTDHTDAELAARNVHNVPEDAIKRMRERWED